MPNSTYTRATLHEALDGHGRSLSRRTLKRTGVNAEVATEVDKLQLRSKLVQKCNMVIVAGAVMPLEGEIHAKM